MNTSVLILAGGLATRLRPLTENFPKALIDINGVPFINYQLKMLKAQGFNNIVLCIGYEGKQIEDYILSQESFGLNIEFSYDGKELLGTGGAIRKALPLLSDPFVVIYGDSYLNANYRDILNYFLSYSDVKALMTVYKNADLYDKSNVLFQGGKLLVYDKKNRLPQMEHIDWGLGILKKSAFEDKKLNEKFDLAELYTSLVEKQLMIGYEVSERFYEIGSLQGIEEFSKSILS